MSAFEELGLLKEITGQKRSRMFRYEPYLALFDDTINDEEAPDDSSPPDVTGPSGPGNRIEIQG